jgi:sugar phosphate isomerase/epimerase
MTSGMIDWREVVGALAAARYDGSFSIDHLAGKPTAGLLRAERDQLLVLGAAG